MYVHPVRDCNVNLLSIYYLISILNDVGYYSVTISINNAQQLFPVTNTLESIHNHISSNYYVQTDVIIIISTHLFLSF